MEPLLEVRHLHVAFRTEDGVAEAVDDLSLTVSPGEILGIVGESGSGKTVSMLAVMRLIRDPNAMISGEVLYRGRDLMALSKDQVRSVRGRDRDDLPGSDDGSDARVLVGWQIAEQIQAHTRVHRRREPSRRAPTYRNRQR